METNEPTRQMTIADGQNGGADTAALLRVAAMTQAMLDEAHRAILDGPRGRRGVARVRTPSGTPARCCVHPAARTDRPCGAPGTSGAPAPHTIPAGGPASSPEEAAAAVPVASRIGAARPATGCACRAGSDLPNAPGTCTPRRPPRDPGPGSARRATAATDRSSPPRDRRPAGHPGAVRRRGARARGRSHRRRRHPRTGCRGPVRRRRSSGGGSPSGGSAGRGALARRRRSPRG
jgi:hypothetical protein